MSAGRRPAWLPSESNELLLRAALADDTDALQAWRDWSARTTPEEADLAAHQVMPLVWRRFSRLDPKAEGMDLLKGVYRYTWVRNKVLLGFGAEVLGELRLAGIETLVLKGAALSLLHYRDLGVRLMADFDVLVPRESALDAIAVLRRSLQPDPDRPSPESPEERVPVEHSTSFVDRPDREVDLHWYALWQSSPDEDFWAASVPIEIEGVASRTLCATDHLVQICAHGAHGASWDQVPVLRWVPDAMAVLNSQPGADWDRLTAQARSRELTATMAEALGYLRSAFGASVPAEVLEELRSAPAPLSERIGRQAATRPTSMLARIGLHWERYRRLKRLDPSAARAPSFPAHLRQFWGYERYRDFLAYGVRRALTGRRSNPAR